MTESFREETQRADGGYIVTSGGYLDVDRLNTRLQRIEAAIKSPAVPLEELLDAACRNLERVIKYLAEAGRPGLAELESHYLANIRMQYTSEETHNVR